MPPRVRKILEVVLGLLLIGVGIVTLELGIGFFLIPVGMAFLAVGTGRSEFSGG